MTHFTISPAGLVGFFLDVFVGALGLCILLVGPVLLISHFKKVGKRKALIYMSAVAIAISCMVTIGKQITQSEAVSDQKFKNDSDEMRIKEIVAGVLNGSINPKDDEIRQEFSSILIRNGFDTTVKKDKFREVVTQSGITYQRVLIEDAYRSIAERKPIRSQSRYKLETALVNSGLMQTDRFEKNKAFIQAAATGGTIPGPGGDFVVNEETLGSIAENLKEADERINILFGKFQ